MLSKDGWLLALAVCSTHRSESGVNVLANKLISVARKRSDLVLRCIHVNTGTMKTTRNMNTAAQSSRCRVFVSSSAEDRLAYEVLMLYERQGAGIRELFSQRGFSR